MQTRGTMRGRMARDGRLTASPSGRSVMELMRTSLPGRLSHALLGLLVGVLSALPGLAHASAPDPSWIAGIYDAADHDDVVILVTSATSSVAPDPAVDITPVLLAVGTLSSFRDSVGLQLPLSAVLPRGPPAS